LARNIFATTSSADGSKSLVWDEAPVTAESAIAKVERTILRVGFMI